MQNDNTHTELTFPETEAEGLRRAYIKANVILEYGSGGSTMMAASMKGKYIISVESDKDWAISLQKKIDQQNLPSKAVVWHSDIGPTGEWGRPLDEKNWRLFHRYPTKVWSEPFFKHPDVVLIDGRFRAATLIAVILRARRKIVILFDDYQDRSAYHIVERIIKPVRFHGRMAEFHADKRNYPLWVHDIYNELLGHVVLANQKSYPYKEIGDIWPNRQLEDGK